MRFEASTSLLYHNSNTMHVLSAWYIYIYIAQKNLYITYIHTEREREASS